MNSQSTTKNFEIRIEQLKNYETQELRYSLTNPIRYEGLVKKRKIISIGHKRRGAERSVKIGYITSPFSPYVRSLYITPRRRSSGEGKVTLVVASKGVGKTNLTRLYTQAFYRASRFPIIVFQEKRGDLDFTRRQDPELLASMGIKPIKLPNDCQKFLIPGENYKIPLAEIEYTEIMDYIGKRIGSSIGDRIIQRIWNDRYGNNHHINLDTLKEAVNDYLRQIEEREDSHVEVIRSTINRFLDLIELDKLIESERVRDFLDYIDPEKINIIDLSKIGDDYEKQFIVASTLRMLENHYPEQPCFVALTESHVYAPTGKQPASLSVIMRVVTVLARSYGWNVLLETQSPQNLHPRVLENVDEIFVFGYISKSKRQALSRMIQMNLEDIIEPFYAYIRNINKGEGLYATITDFNTPYYVTTFLSPVG